MAAPTVKGDTNYKFAIPTADVTISNLTVESASLETSAQVEAEAVGQLGLVEAFAVGGEKYTLRASGYFKGTPPAVAASVTVYGQVGFVTNVSLSGANRDWKKVEITATGFENISS